MEVESCSIPRIIWIMWYQGFDEAPEVVQKCLASWKKYNPTWKIISLDKNNLENNINLRDVVDIHRKDISIQEVSNIVRINLLAKYGGVWVDATCFCCQSLDDWIDYYASSGFFAFNKPGRDRLLSNWFLASGKNCYLTAVMCRENNLFWSSNYFTNQQSNYGRITVWILAKVLNRNSYTTRWWFSFLILKVFKVYPYFTVHYLFSEIIRKDDLCKKIWNETRKISADIPHKLQRVGLLQALPEEIKEDIDSRKAPLYKLTWKHNKSAYPKGCILDYLLRSI